MRRVATLNSPTNRALRLLWLHGIYIEVARVPANFLFAMRVVRGY